VTRSFNDAHELRKEGDPLEVYFCGNCGTVCVNNHRDSNDGCPSCHVCMNWRKLRSAVYFFDGGEAPHIEDPDV
jgi:hypothetical protein